MHASLLEAQPRRETLQAVFGRSARIALAGLLAAPALFGLASFAGYRVPVGVDPAFWLAALAGFAAAGWCAGRSLGLGRAREAYLAGALLLAALPVASAFRGLQGLTGRESILAVAAATLPAFVLAFALAGTLAARIIGAAAFGLRGALTCAAGGLAGGAFAMLPFCWAWLRVDVPGESYLAMTAAVVGFLGCLIAPFSAVGNALDRARDPAGLARP